jgi:hypothetical protein
VFTWFTSEEDEWANTSVVTLTIEPDGKGCVATLAHALDLGYADFVPRVEAGWGRMLAQTAALLQP